MTGTVPWTMRALGRILAYLSYKGKPMQREIEILPPEKPARKKLRCITFQSYDYETNGWKKVERYLDEDGSPAYTVTTPLDDDEDTFKFSAYREGFDAFKDSQLQLGWEDLGKLNSHDPKTEDFVDFWRGWFSSARLSWYFDTDKKEDRI